MENNWNRTVIKKIDKTIKVDINQLISIEIYRLQSILASIEIIEL